MMVDANDRKPTVRRRRRAGQGGKGGMSRILWLVALLCVLGAVILFRTSKNGQMPVGLGEKRTVVTAPEAGEAPASGEVDIARQGLQLTPEKQVAGSDLGSASNEPLEVDARLPEGTPPDKELPPPTSGTGTTKPATDEPAPAPVTNPDPIKPEPAEPGPSTNSTTTTPSTMFKPATVVPSSSGQFLVQAASLGDQEKAQAAADRLQQAGWDAVVRAAGRADGGMTYRVQIGYFATREDAQSFINQNKAKLPGAIPAHR